MHNVSGSPGLMMQGFPDVIYAPTLEYAFKLARIHWPSADGWTCLGRQDDHDPGVVRDR